GSVTRIWAAAPQRSQRSAAVNGVLVTVAVMTPPSSARGLERCRESADADSGRARADRRCVDPSAFTMPDAHGQRVVPDAGPVPGAGRPDAVSSQVNVQVNRRWSRMFTAGEQTASCGVPCHIVAPGT